MKFRTVVIENPARLSYESGYMVVRTSESQVRIHLSEIQMILVVSQQSNVSMCLLAQLALAKIPLVVMDNKENPVGEFLPLCGAHNMSKRIREQIDWGEVIKKQVWKFVIQEKIAKQSDVLLASGFIDESKLLMDAAKSVKSADSSNREAYAARIYFETLFGKGFTRDIPCFINAALNYGYAILLSSVNREIVSRGYLMQLGIHHRSEFNHYNLGCDFMEPFRPVVDKVVLNLEGEEFTTEHKRLLQGILNEEVYYKGGCFSLKSTISRFTSDCLKVLSLDSSVSDLVGYEFV